MVSWVPQIVVPPLLALAFFRPLPRRWVVWMAPTIFRADLDYAVPGEHRVWTHTLLWPLLVLGALAWAWRRRSPGTKFLAYASRPGWPVASLLLTYYLSAHAVMDIFTGGVVLFWPVSNLNVFADIEVFFNPSTGTLEPQVDSGTSQGPFPLDPHYPWVTADHSAILAFLVACLLAWLVVRITKALRIARRT